MPSIRSISWLTTLSLDAPLVAIAWQELIAASTGETINWTQRVLVFASVWLGYSADRWLDAFRYKNTTSKRHIFHKKYRDILFGTWVIILSASILLAFLKLERHDLIRGTLLATFSLIVTFLVQKKIFGKQQNWPKSILTASLVTASAGLFSMPSFESQNLGYAILLAAPFGLFLYNCLLIHHWDTELDEAHHEGLNLPTDTLKRRLLIILILSEVTSLLCWIALDSKMFAATTFSFSLLLLLQRANRHIERDIGRTLADLSLLSPLLFIVL